VIRWGVLLAALLALPFAMGEYYINLTSQIFIFAIFVSSINLLLGYGGLPTLGHA
jgi:branched-chain amino acid transport system permease protein